MTNRPSISPVLSLMIAVVVLMTGGMAFALLGPTPLSIAAIAAGAVAVGMAIAQLLGQGTRSSRKKDQHD